MVLECPYLSENGEIRNLYISPSAATEYMLLSEGQQDVDSAIPNPPLDPKMTHYGVRAHIESTWPEHRFSTPEIEIIGADRPNQSTSSCYGNSKPTRNRVPKNNQKRLRDTVSLDAHLRHHPISPYRNTTFAKTL